MMLEELQRRNYSEITTRKYLQYVTAFARHFGKSPDQLGPNELRSYQAYLLQERKVTPGTAVNCVAALRFFFIKTLKRHQFREFLPYPKDRRRLPTVLSPEEVSRLINAAGTLFRRTLLMTSKTLAGQYLYRKTSSRRLDYGRSQPAHDRSAPTPANTHRDPISLGPRGYSSQYPRKSPESGRVWNHRSRRRGLCLTNRIEACVSHMQITVLHELRTTGNRNVAAGHGSSSA